MDGLSVSLLRLATVSRDAPGRRPLVHDNARVRSVRLARDAEAAVWENTEEQTC